MTGLFAISSEWNLSWSAPCGIETDYLMPTDCSTIQGPP